MKHLHCLLFGGSALILLTGYLDIACQLFVKLEYGDLAISQGSRLARPLKSIIPGLEYKELGSHALQDTKHSH
ncbi:MAG: hypothetical protein SWZ49_33170 [Cyanobacteriota bacterium]|nr:hypothetical protein [Cyanobacteriota bacterium]